MFSKKNNLKVFYSLLALNILILVLHGILRDTIILNKSYSIFDIDRQVTFASHFGTVVSFTIGLLTLLTLSYFREKKDKIINTIIGIFFIILSYDEIIEIHEEANHYFKQFFKNDGIKDFIAFNWIYPLIIPIIIIISVFILKVYREKNKAIKLQYIFGILSFVGVLFFELYSQQNYGHEVFDYLIIFEEGLEMFGVSLFLLATLNTISEFQQTNKKSSS